MNLEEVKKYFDTEIGYEDGTKMLMLIADNKNMEGVSFVQRLTNCSFEIAQQMWGILKNQYGTKETNPMIPDLTPQQIAAANAQAQGELVVLRYTSGVLCAKVKLIVVYRGGVIF